MARSSSTGSTGSSGGLPARNDSARTAEPQAGSTPPSQKRRLSGARQNGSLMVSLVTGGCILALTIIARYVLDAELDFISQFAPVWVFCVYLGVGKRPESSATRWSGLVWSLAIAAVTVAVLAVYAI